ncbi:MAG TPA: hypothetical protein VGK99_08185 [Acidobacteriota bacterium]
MKKFVAVSLFVALALSLLALAESKSGSLTGFVSDAKCAKAGAKHAGCAAKCISGGEKAVLVVDKDIYAITNQDSIKGHEGHEVKVTGSVNTEAKQITIEKVEMVESK